MITILLSILVFFISLVFYLHIQSHLQTSDENKIYEINELKDKLIIEEIWNLKQPVLFNLPIEEGKIIQNTNFSQLHTQFPTQMIQIKEEVSVPLSLADTIFSSDSSGNVHYLSEKNVEFLKQTGIQAILAKNDSYIRPYFSMNCDYDIMIGSKYSQTILKYELNVRTFYIITQGSVDVKLASPKQISPTIDYEKFEFTSSINAFDNKSNIFIDMILHTGQIIFIPAYWWVSFRFREDKTSITSFKYRTITNNLAILPHLCMWGLQQLNVKYL